MLRTTAPTGWAELVSTEEAQMGVLAVVIIPVHQVQVVGWEVEQQIWCDLRLHRPCTVGCVESAAMSDLIFGGAQSDVQGASARLSP